MKKYDSEEYRKYLIKVTLLNIVIHIVIIIADVISFGLSIDFLWIVSFTHFTGGWFLYFVMSLHVVVLLGNILWVKKIK